MTALLAERSRVESEIALTLDAVVVLVEGGSWTASESLEWWEWARALGVPGAAGRIMEALGGVTLNDLMLWRRQASAALAGTFPLNNQHPPPSGQPCVYLLFDKGDHCVYVGQSLGVRSRLATHWNQRRIPAVRWEVRLVRSASEALRLESDLIFELQPAHNVVGRVRAEKKP